LSRPPRQVWQCGSTIDVAETNSATTHEQMKNEFSFSLDNPGVK
jgi:hypothetical protein